MGKEVKQITNNKLKERVFSDMISQKTKKFLKDPIIFSKNIDPFILFLFAFSGAMIATTLDEVPLWQILLIIIPVASILTLILKVIGKKWRDKKAIKEN